MSIRTAQRMADVLEDLVSRRAGATTRQVAESIDHTMVTTRRTLQVLEVVGLVRSRPPAPGQGPAVTWWVGPKLYAYASRVASRLRA